MRVALGLVLVVAAACVAGPQETPTPEPTATASPSTAAAYCAIADVLTATRGYDDHARTILDRTYTLPREYVPPDLVPASRAGVAGPSANERLRAIVVPDLTAMREAAARDGIALVVFSGYRSYDEQKTTFEHWVKVGGYEDAIRTSARAGHSEHQLGTALDLGAGTKAPWDDPGFASGPVARWLAAHASDYGFALSYPAEKELVTCYAYEPWHFRWLGRDLAARVRASGLTLREFLAS